MAKHLFPLDQFWLESLVPVDGIDDVVLLGAGVSYTVWSARVGGDEYTTFLTDTDGITAIVPTADSNGKRPWVMGPDTQATGEVVVMYCDVGFGDRTPMYADDALGLALLGEDITVDISDVDGLADALQQISTAAVKSVNNQTPDASGNVDVATGGGSGTVTSVAGVSPVSGNVPLTLDDVGGDQLDNTSDANKPVSTAQASALATKAADAEISDANLQNTSSSTRGLITGRRIRAAQNVYKVAAGELWRVMHNGTSWPALSTVPADFIAAGGGINWDSSPYSGAAAPSEARNEIDYWTKLEV